VAGSAADPSRARAAVDRLRASVLSLVAVAALGTEASVAATAGAPVLTLGSLDDLPRTLWAVTR
jgi:hypothetical protein